MKITQTRLRRIIRETYKKLLTEDMISGDFLAEAAYEAMNEGVKTLANFVLWIRLNYPDYVQGLSKRDISKEASFYWKAEKKDRSGSSSRYDTPGWGRFDQEKTMVDRYLRALLNRLGYISHDPDAIEEIMQLSDKTKEALYRGLQQLEDDVRRNKNSRRFY